MAMSAESGDDDRYTLVVAVANPGTVGQLMRTAIDLAKGRDGEIHVVSVAHKPASSPFLLFPDEHLEAEYADDQQAVLEKAADYAADAAVSVETHVRVGVDVADEIEALVGELDADALLLGWRERPRPADIVIGSTVDPIVRRAPVDTYIERVGQTADGVETILLATDGGGDIEPAARLVESVATANDAEVLVVSYVTPEDDPEAHEQAREAVETAASWLGDVPVETSVAETDDVAGAIVSEGRSHDFIALGATRERRFRRPIVGSVAEEVGKRATVPVVIAKARREPTFVGRLLRRG